MKILPWMTVDKEPVMECPYKMIGKLICRGDQITLLNSEFHDHELCRRGDRNL